MPPPQSTILESKHNTDSRLCSSGIHGELSACQFLIRRYLLTRASYCNSIVQALYYSVSFRENVVNYPQLSPSGTPNGTSVKINIQIRPPNPEAVTSQAANKKGITSSQAFKQRQAINAGQPVPGQPVRAEDKPDTPEYKKKQAMIKGPVLELARENSAAYGMEECTFTGLRDIFGAIMQSDSRTGVLSPQRFLEIFRRDNEMFRNSMHQDAHEFYGLVLNDVIANVEATARRQRERERERERGRAQDLNEEGLAKSLVKALGGSEAIMKTHSGTGSPGTGWVHDIFEGVLVSETRCLTCETASQRDETFLDLSIDLEEHSSVTSCLRKFSAEEMLCERNKFHCDHCGGLQEAEKRMKIKKLPKVLALHLKRFKYSDDFTKLEKLFHRVVYPYQLRMFNTTDDADDPDRMYELYAVVVHIGSNAYHGHYVSIIKTPDRGWLLFDDEMVEPVDKHFVRNFFGDKPGTASAYVLFYQETTFERVVAEQEAEGLEEVKLASQKADLAQGNLHPNGSAALSKLVTVPVSPVDDHDEFVSLEHAQSAPGGPASPTPAPPLPGIVSSPTAPVGSTAGDKAIKLEAKSKEDKEKDKKEAKAAEKARKAAEKEQAKQDEKARKEREARKKTEDEDDAARKKEGSEAKSPGFLKGSQRTSRSIGRKGLGFLSGGKDKDKDKAVEPAAKAENVQNGNSTNGGPSTQPSQTQQTAAAAAVTAVPDKEKDKPEKHALKERFSFGLGRKKSMGFT